MNYKLTTPCNECPFLIGSHFTMHQLLAFSSGEFACHKTCDLVETDDGPSEFHQKSGHKSPHCAGALIFLEKRGEPHQMMRICERLGMYDASKLNMEAPVIENESDCTAVRRR